MADTPCDADHLRQAIAAKGALAVIPNNPSRALKYPLDKHLNAQRHLLQQAQAVPPRRNPLRKDRPKLPRSRRSASILLWMRYLSTLPRRRVKHVLFLPIKRRIAAK